MDTALELKTGIDNGIKFSDQQIDDKLNRSDLLKKLTQNLPGTPLALVLRLISISEIPHSSRLTYTKKLIDKVYEKLSVPFGFSLSGDKKMFLPCYNAMIVSALCRLGRANDNQLRNAVDWINTHQPMERGLEVDLPGFNFDRYGGCFKKTPCYIGLAKSVFALQEYQDQTKDTKYDAQLKKGIDYILEHRFFKRLSNDEPINKHITDISFPESYHLNVVELLRFAGKANLLGSKNAKDLILFFENARTKDGNWKNSFRYKADGYVCFDRGKKASDWTTQIIRQSLRQD